MPAAAATSSPLERLVEQQYVGFGGQRPRDRHPLGLTPGQLPRFTVGELLGIHLAQPAQRRRFPVAVRGANPTSVAVRSEGDVGGDAHVRKQQRILQEQPHPSMVGCDVHPGRGVGQHPIAQPHHSLVGANQPGDDVEGGRLAGTVGPEHGEHLARRHRELHVQIAFGDNGTKL